MTILGAFLLISRATSLASIQSSSLMILTSRLIHRDIPDLSYSLLLRTYIKVVYEVKDVIPTATVEKVATLMKYTKATEFHRLSRDC